MVFLEGVYGTSLKADMAQTLESATDRSMKKLDEIYRNYVGYDFTPGYALVSLTNGDTLMLTIGSSFILLSGSATLTVTGGTVINVTTGCEVASGIMLERYQRYFCAENTTALITANSSSTGQVDGYYLAEGSGISFPNRPHPVFRDVREANWFYAAVDFVFNNGLFQGMTATTFSPGTSMTRGMFVTVLHRLDSVPATGAAGAFTDVQDPAQYYYNAVIWANANNIVTGYGDGTFRPNASVTREQMATIMHRYAKYKDRDMRTLVTEFDNFPDRNDVSDYAVDAMHWAVSWRVITGSDGKLLPRDTATRAQVAQIIYNYVERVGTG